MIAAGGLPAMRTAIRAAFPELRGGTIARLADGWHMVALEAGGWVFRFPKTEEALAALIREAGLLSRVRPAVTLPVPDLIVVDGAFSRHAKIAGDHLLAADYAKLDERSRDRLADALALFHAELHGLDRETMRAAGATRVEPWLEPDAIMAGIAPLLDRQDLAGAERAIARWSALPPDPHGEIYGQFDGHGWNMAFDHSAARLNGMYDFADSGLGAVHRDLIYAAWIGRDLMLRVARRYQVLVGRVIDADRLDLLALVLRLHELAACSGEATEHRNLALRLTREWLADEVAAGARPV